MKEVNPNTTLSIRKIIFVILWALVFCIGSALLVFVFWSVLLGFGSGVLFYKQAEQGLNPAANTAPLVTMSMFWLTRLIVAVSLVAGLAGLILGGFGWLPGTKSRPR